jgi:hypothetical protein
MLDRILAAARTPARSLARVAPRVPPPIVAVVDRSLAFEKDARFPTTRAMRDALRAAATSLGLSWEKPAPSKSRPDFPVVPMVHVVDRPESITLDPNELVDERSIATRLLEKTPVALAPKVRAPREDVGEVPDVEIPSLVDTDADADDQMPTLVRPMPTPKKRRS